MRCPEINGKVFHLRGCDDEAAAAFCQITVNYRKCN